MRDTGREINASMVWHWQLHPRIITGAQFQKSTQTHPRNSLPNKNKQKADACRHNPSLTVHTQNWWPHTLPSYHRPRTNCNHYHHSPLEPLNRFHSLPYLPPPLPPSPEPLDLWTKDVFFTLELSISFFRVWRPSPTSEPLDLSIKDVSFKSELSIVWRLSPPEDWLSLVCFLLFESPGCDILGQEKKNVEVVDVDRTSCEVCFENKAF